MSTVNALFTEQREDSHSKHSITVMVIYYLVTHDKPHNSSRLCELRQ